MGAGTDPPEPLAVGDRVTLTVGDETLPACVCALSSWNYIAVRGDDGRLWMDVMMNRSAAYWSRLVELESGVECSDSARLDAVASACAYSLGQEPVAGIVRVCATGDRLNRAA